jgi:hypothetical protein
VQKNSNGRSKRTTGQKMVGSANNSLKRFLSESKRIFGELNRQNPDPAIFEVRDELNRLVKCGELSIHDGNEFLHNPSQRERAINETKNDRKDDAISTIVEELKIHKKDIGDIKLSVSWPVALTIAVIGGVISGAAILAYSDFQNNAKDVAGGQEHFALCDNGATCNFNNTSIQIYYKNQNYKNKTPFHPHKFNRSTMYRPQRIGNGSY